MSIPPSLADQFGSLRNIAEEDSARGWLPASVQTLIMAFLARIFGRLEQMFLLWQSGDLPNPASGRPQTGTSSCDRAGMSGQLTHPFRQAAHWMAAPASHGGTRGHTQGGENRPRILEMRANLCRAKPTPAMPPPNPAPGRTPSRVTPPGTARSSAPRCSARDPPAFRRPTHRKTSCARSLKHIHIVAISECCVMP